MPKNPKQEKEGSAEKDQKERGYYYDDSHGYEEYEEEDDDGLEREEADEESERSNDQRLCRHDEQRGFCLADRSHTFGGYASTLEA